MYNSRIATSADWPFIHDLTDECFGVGYANSLVSIFNNPKSFVRIGEENGKKIGFSLTFIQNNIGVLKSICITPEARRKGAGTRLTKDSFADLIKEDIDEIQVVAWRRADTNLAPLEIMMKQFPVSKSIVLEDYWLKDSQLKGYNCSVCGNPCNCSAQLISIPSSDLEGYID